MYKGFSIRPVRKLQTNVRVRSGLYASVPYHEILMEGCAKGLSMFSGGHECVLNFILFYRFI